MNEEYFLLREQISHGNAMFPLMVHELETNPAFQERVNCHWHNEIEILTVTAGSAYVHIDGRSICVCQGNVIFIPSNCLHSITGTPGTPFSFFAVVFDQALLNSFVNDRIQQKYIDSLRNGEILFPTFLSTKEEWEQHISRLLTDIRNAFTKGAAGFELLIKAKLFEIWYLLYLHAGKSQSEISKETDYRITLTKSIIEYIKLHYDNSVSLDKLSREFGISKGHLCRLFKSITKMSVVEYLNFYRISMSASLLRETDFEISKVAVMTGFNNISYYNKMFLRYMHMTPSKFRNL